MDKKTKAPYGFSMPILLLFGLVGQLAWSVENMYFNLFVFEEIAPNLDVVTLMVQLSGITATVVTLIAGTLSDKIGKAFTYLCDLRICREIFGIDDIASILIKEQNTAVIHKPNKSFLISIRIQLMTQKFVYRYAKMIGNKRKH